MAKEPFEQFAMPNEVRAFVEQSVSQARKAFDGFVQAANKAMAQRHGQTQAARAAPAKSRISRWHMRSRTWRQRSISPRS